MGRGLQDEDNEPNPEAVAKLVTELLSETMCQDTSGASDRRICGASEAHRALPPVGALR